MKTVLRAFGSYVRTFRANRLIEKFDQRRLMSIDEKTSALETLRKLARHQLPPRVQARAMRAVGKLDAELCSCAPPSPKLRHLLRDDIVTTAGEHRLIDTSR